MQCNVKYLLVVSTCTYTSFLQSQKYNRISCVPHIASIIQLAKSTLHCCSSLQPQVLRSWDPGWPQLAECSVIAVRRRGKICGWCNPILSPQPQQGTAGHCGIATLAGHGPVVHCG